MTKIRENETRNALWTSVKPNFFQLQREALLGQLERNRREIEATCEELDLLLESDEANYDLFVDRLGQRRRQVAESCANSEFHEA